MTSKSRWDTRSSLIVSGTIDRVNRPSASMSLVSSVATSYIVLRSLDRQLEIAQATARNFEGTLRIFELRFKAGMIGGFDTQLAFEFFQGFANHALVTLHIDNLKGDNAHHQCETVFKAFARALRMAVARDPRAGGAIPSTKGSL